MNVVHAVFIVVTYIKKKLFFCCILEGFSVCDMLDISI